ncbi:hypothetical protein HDE76_000231 [Rhodanobacter sp. ANJX3]|nr:hypothetical protein [Rhodanobacter sp. ANJX3]NYE27121.1 hypothetical protein [Rhodanobacter sp. K2T2]
MSLIDHRDVFTLSSAREGDLVIDPISRCYLARAVVCF